MTDLATIRAAVGLAQANGREVITLEVAALAAALDAMDAALAKVKPARAAVPKHTFTPGDEKVAQWMFDLVREVSPSAKEPSWAAWSNEIRLMRTIDKRAAEEICALFQWAHDDSFWCSNILSPKKLREKWDQLAAKRARPAVKSLVRETVGERNARLEAQFLGQQPAFDVIDMER